MMGLSQWLQAVLGLDQDHVVNELDNGVPMPTGGFALMSQGAQKRIGTNLVTYQDVPDAGTETLQQSVDQVVGVDLYGPDASDWAATVATVWWSEAAVDFLASYGITPLYAEDPVKLPLVNGEEQYELRWNIRLHLQSYPIATAPMQFCTNAKINVVNVETLS